MKGKSLLLLIVILGVLGWVSSYQVPKVNAVIWIGGHITSDTTWTPVDTYRVINDTFVDPNATLTILPGVHVQFADSFSLNVQGSLNATGTDDGPIVFTSSRVSPSAGAWNTIDFKGTSNCSFALEHVKVEFAVNGITVESQGYATVARSELFNCSESGIMIKGMSNLVIEENTIEHNKNGIATDSSDNHAGILVIGNTVSSNTNNGIYLYAYTYSGQCSLQNVTFSSNTIYSNSQNGICLYANTVWYPGGGNIHDINFSSNSVYLNALNGIILQTWFDGGDASIYNITFSSNTIHSNSQNGIYLQSGKNPIHEAVFFSNSIYSNAQDGLYLNAEQGSYNVSFSSNTISSNRNGIHLYGIRRSFVSGFDLTAFGNRIAANTANGIYIESFPNPDVVGLRSKITENSIVNNLCGVLYETTGNLAFHNDIYSNTFGMNVSARWGGASVNAEYNYWGDSTGPFNPSINPEGKGNPVNGNGVDLNFIPFLTSPQGHINQPPIAALSTDKSTVNINETVTFDATNSTDDGRIDYYLFDFGDGTNSSWTTLPVVLHQYGSAGNYYANLTIMDDYGVTSNDTAMQAIMVSTQVPEFLSFAIVPLFMLSALVTVILSKKHRSTHK